MKRNRLVSAFLCLVLSIALIFSLTACGKTSDPDPSSSTSLSSLSSLSSEGLSSEETEYNPEELGNPVEPEKSVLDKIIAAKQKNDDVVGWLTVPNTTINDPVVQHESSNSYYSRLNYEGYYDWYGCYWAHFRANIGTRDEMSKNLTIFGHSMDDDPNGLKFSQMKKYLKQDFASKNPYVYFSTTTDDMVWKVFACFYCEASFDYIKVNPTETEFMAMIDDVRRRSQLNFDVDVLPSDKILTFSTCTYLYGSTHEQRYVVMARLVRAGEPTSNTVKVTVNPSPKAPVFS